MVCLALALVLTVLFAPIAWAESTEDYYTEQLEESGAADLPEQLPQETQHTLEELGIDGTDWQALTSITPEALFSEIGGMAQENARGPLQAAASVIAVIDDLANALAKFGSMQWDETVPGGKAARRSDRHGWRALRVYHGGGASGGMH